MADDGIKLTNDEVRELTEGGVLPSGHKAVVSIVAARVQELTAERDNFEANCAHWMKSYEQQTEFARQMTGERDAARAELAAANTRIAELEDYVHGVAGGALVEEAEQSVRRIHAEVERDMARQALTSADAMNRWWDEINAERDRLNTENAALSARLERVRALADEWDAERAVLIRNASVANESSRFTTALRAALGEDT